jgi:hypothetical protein
VFRVSAFSSERRINTPAAAQPGTPAEAVYQKIAGGTPRFASPAQTSLQ